MELLVYIIIILIKCYSDIYYTSVLYKLCETVFHIQRFHKDFQACKTGHCLHAVFVVDKIQVSEKEDERPSLIIINTLQHEKS